LHISRSNTAVFKSRRMSRVGHVALLGRTDMHTEFWWGNQEEKRDLQEQVVDGRTVSKCILENIMRVVWTGLIWLMIGKSGGLL
jgi:hypothetical protein